MHIHCIYTCIYIPKLDNFMYGLVYCLARAAMSNQVTSQKEQPKSWNNLTLPTENFRTFPAQSPYPAPFSNDPISKAPIQRWHYHHVMSCKSKTNGKHLDALRNWLEVPFVEWAAPGSCSPAMELEYPRFNKPWRGFKKPELGWCMMMEVDL